MSKPDIKQFRLSTGEEVICEVLEWDNEESASIVVRGILRIVETENWKTGIRLIAFRPFMAFNEDPKIIQTLNSEHIIAESFPQYDLMKMYAKCIVKINKDIDKWNSLPAFDLDELNHLDDDELGEYLKKELDALKYKDTVSHDSDENNNVIKFRPKDTTIH